MASSLATASTSRAVHTSVVSQAHIIKAFGIKSKQAATNNSVAAASPSPAVESSSRPHFSPADWSERTVTAAQTRELAKSHFKLNEVGKAFTFAEESAKDVLSTRIPRSLRRDFVLTQQPTTVLRKVSVEVAEALDPKAHVCKQLVGDSGSGRSTILLQTIARCRSDGWAVLYIPDAHELVNGSYAYAPLEGQPNRYEQPTLAQHIVQNFSKAHSTWRKKANKDLIAKLDAGAKDPKQAQAALEALLESATETSASPLLIAIDGAEALQGTSLYRSSRNEPIQASCLSVPRLLRQYANGQKPLANGAIILAADKKNVAFSGSGKVEEVKVGALDLKEAAGLFSHLNDIKLLDAGISDSTFLEAFVSSDGNARIFSRGLRNVPGGTARGNIKKGRSRGVPQRADKMITVTV